MKKREAKYVKIDIVNKIIYRHYSSIYASGLDIVLEDPLIEIDDKGLHVSGEEWQWDFFRVRQWVEDMDKKPREGSVSYGHKTLKDLFTGVKRPYAKWWCLYEDTKHVDYHFNQWAIV